MMDCVEARQRWHRHVDEDRRDQELEAHLVSCKACRTYADQVARILTALDDLRSETERVVSQRAGNAGPPTTPETRPRWIFALRATAAIAAAIGIFLGVSLFHASNDTARLDPGEQLRPILGIALQGESTERYMVVARETSEPDVQLFWLYPTLTKTVNRDGS